MAALRTRIRADGSTAFQVLFRRGGRGSRQESMTFNTVEGASAFMDLVNRHGAATAVRIVERRAEGDTSETVAQVLRWHIDSLGRVEARTRQAYETTLREWVLPFALAELPTAALSQEDVQSWVDQLFEVDSARTGKPLSGKSIKNRHSDLSTALSHAVRAGRVSRNVAEGATLPRTVKRKPVFLSQREFELINGFVDDDMGRALFALLAGTGLRPGEATALRVEHVDLLADVPSVVVAEAWKDAGRKADLRLGPPKTDAGDRTVSLAPETVEVLAPLVKGKSLDALVFSLEGGVMIPNWTVNARFWQPARARAIEAGLRKSPRVYDLRHTHASWLIQKGVPLPVIQRRLGHESIQTTVDVYGHLADDALAVAADATSLALRGL